jgi:hypothetical protein
MTLPSLRTRLAKVLVIGCLALVIDGPQSSVVAAGQLRPAACHWIGSVAYQPRMNHFGINIARERAAPLSGGSQCNRDKWYTGQYQATPESKHGCVFVRYYKSDGTISDSNCTNTTTLWPTGPTFRDNGMNARVSACIYFGAGVTCGSDYINVNF